MQTGARIEHRADDDTATRIVVRGSIVGLLAGLAMAMVVMLYGFLFEEAGAFFDAPMAIWAWLFGAEHYGDAVNHVFPIVLGLGALVVVSVIIGIVFTALMHALRVRDAVVPVSAGIVYGLVVWVVLRYAVLPLNDAEEQLFTTDTVAPQWVWWLAFAALGLTAGVVYARFRKRAEARSTDEPGSVSAARRTTRRRVVT